MRFSIDFLEEAWDMAMFDLRQQQLIFKLLPQPVHYLFIFWAGPLRVSFY
jgi:hypothetical protein